MSTHLSTPLPSVRRVWFTPLLSLLLLLLTTAACVSQAHDWPSPTPLHRKPGPATDQPGSLDAWAGLQWAGPRSGPPAAPDARDCNRAPEFYEMPDPAPRHQTIWRRAEPGLGSHRSADEASVAGKAASTSPTSAAPPAPPAPPAPTAALATPLSPATAAAPSPGALESARQARAAGNTWRDASAALAHNDRPAAEPVTAGMVDDNADFGSYLAFTRRTAQLPLRQRDVSERYLLTVNDADGRPVSDAQVSLHAAGRALPLWARTDAGGQVWLHPRVAGITARVLEVQVRKPFNDGELQGSAILQRGQRDQLQVRLDSRLPAQRARLDLVFLVDATGSMADEIDKLRRSMQAMADQIAQLPSRPVTCFALVAYRDRGDAFFVRAHDFTNDLAAFQQVLGGLQAGGGGDYPEAVNEALHTAVHRLSWRGDGATRLVVLVGDAPPHLDTGAPWYDDDMQGAVARGIKLFAIGASGLDKRGEAVWRQLAQYTGGRFVFLTYADARNPASGPGRETVHEVDNYSVQTLDKLVVRLVKEELARRAS